MGKQQPALRHDFGTPDVSGGTKLTKKFNDGGAMAYEITAPGTVGNVVKTRSTLGTRWVGAKFDQTEITVTIVGQPDEKSTAACVGDRSKTASVRVGEKVTCTITALDAGNTAVNGIRSDFAAAAIVGGNSYVPGSPGTVSGIDGGKVFTFTVNAPADLTTSFTITPKLANGKPTASGTITISVVGEPKRQSTLNCVGDRSKTSFVRVNEATTCTIASKDAAGLATTAVATVFQSPSIQGGLSLHPADGKGVKGLLAKASTFTFTMTSPGAVGSIFTTWGKMADGLSFSQGKFGLTVVGTPTAKSTLTCEGKRSGTSTVRINEVVLCTIVVRNDLATTSGGSADFATPEIIGTFTDQKPSTSVNGTWRRQEDAVSVHGKR